MKKFTAIIIDDESKLRKVLQIKLEKHCPEVEIVETAANVDDALRKILKLKPELIFLDISMPGASGFDLLDRFDSIDFEVIFVTGFDNYVLDALKVSAVDYLLKPVVTEDLISAVNKAKIRILNREKVETYDVLRHNLNHIGDQDSKVAIPGTNSYDFVRIRDIVRCEGWQKYTRIYTREGACLTSSYNIGVFKEMLGNYSFFSIHKSHLINTELIARYLMDGTVIMIDDARVPVSRRRRDAFVNEVIKGVKA